MLPTPGAQQRAKLHQRLAGFGHQPANRIRLFICQPIRRGDFLALALTTLDISEQQFWISHVREPFVTAPGTWRDPAT